jgi:hypothetical protein
MLAGGYVERRVRERPPPARVSVVLDRRLLPLPAAVHRHVETGDRAVAMV